jgi:hypothetical protein
MPVTKTEINVAQEVINVLLGDKAEAEAYAENPEGWLDTHGYAGVSGEAIATCGVGGGGASAGASAGGASAGAYAAAPAAGASAVAQLDYIVYNNYYEDNSITNNIENHGNLDFNQQIAGDNSVLVNDSDVSGNVQAGEGNIQVDGDVTDSNLEAGEGDQLVDESVNTDVDVDVDLGTPEAPPEAPPAEEAADPIL